jgi:hypothetical protein
MHMAENPAEETASSDAAASSSDDQIENEEPDFSSTMSDQDWLRIMYPTIVNRAEQENVYYIPFLREAVHHFMHPVLTPFLWLWIRYYHGHFQADLYLSSHVWSLSLERPIASQKNAARVALYSFFNILLPVIPLLLFVLAFARIGGTQNYMVEGIFLLILKAIWSLSVGIKYGFYSRPLQRLLKQRQIPPAYITSEQILMNWAPSIDRLMFELRAASSMGASKITYSPLLVSENHPVVQYCRNCSRVGDEPLCVLQPQRIRDILQQLPASNFHRVFWSRPPPSIRAHDKRYESPQKVDITSYKAFLPADANPNVEMKKSDPAAVVKGTRARLRSLLSADHFDEPQPSRLGSSPVPAGVLLSYCICRAWTFGKSWTGASPHSPPALSIRAFATHGQVQECMIHNRAFSKSILR